MTAGPGDELRIDRHASVERIALASSSWVDVVPGFVRDARAAFADLHDSLPWLQTEVLRYDKYVPERRLGTDVRPDSRPMLRQIGLHLRSRFTVPFTGVAAILYRTGDDFQGLHSDREMRWLDDTLIAIVVLGTRRPFVLRRRADRGVPVERVPAGSDPGDVILMPGEGDMLVMGGACQREWLHGVPKAATDQARISLTWRWTSRRGRPDTNPGYYDGKQFSDAPRQPGSRRRPG
ncbi:MAG: alpha-ketoglutarate-dependent dioxygenase AlkB [Ilumatobacteraceae bacterium]